MFSFKNFYKPAPAQVQRYCAALQAVGGLVAASGAIATYPWLAIVGLAMSALGVGWEKLTAALPPAAGPDLASTSTATL